jgi:hypothetical protein
MNTFVNNDMNVPWSKHSDRTRKVTIKMLWGSFKLYKLIYDPFLTFLSISYTLFSGITRSESWSAAQIHACKLDYEGIGRDGPIQVEHKVNPYKILNRFVILR